MSNSQVKRSILDPRVQSLEQTLNQNRWRWLEHVLLTPTEHLLRCTLFLDSGYGSKMGLGGQSMT